MADASADDFLAKFKREQRTATIEGFGEIYYYDPPTVAERNAFQQHVRYDERTGQVSVSLEAIVDGIIARVKDRNSRPLFRQIHRSRMLAEMTEQTLMAIWNAIGGDAAVKVVEGLSEAAEKK